MKLQHILKSNLALWVPVNKNTQK